jgi:hypothetical protein
VFVVAAKLLLRGGFSAGPPLGHLARFDVDALFHVALANIILLSFDLKILVLNIEAQTIVNAHVLVGDPDKREQGDDITSPIRVQHAKASDNQEKSGHIVAETVFTSEQIEELPPRYDTSDLGLPFAKLPLFTENLFMRDGLCHASKWNGEHK